MLAQFSIADYVVFALALALSAAIGVYYGCTGGKQSTVSEFLMADRKMQLFPAALSILASFMSAITILGTPAETYQYGTMYIWIILSYTFTILISGYIYIPVFYRLRVTSAYEYLEKRFSRGVRIYGAIVYILQTSLYMAMVLYAPALALAQVTGIEVWIAVISSGVVCTFYTALGGMKAVMWTDTLQVLIMYAGMVAGVIQGCIEQGGGSVVWEDAITSGRMNFYNVTQAFDPNPLERHTFWTLAVGGIFTWTAIYAVNQSQVQRALTVPSLKVAQKAYLINIGGLSAFALLGSFSGLIIYSRYKGCDPLSSKVIDSSDQLYPYFVMDILGHLHGLPGLFTAAIYSGALSTISSGLNSVAAVTLEDLVKTSIKPDITDEKATFLSKMLAIGYGVAAIALAFVASQLVGILQAALSLFGILGGPILGMFTLGMFFPCANSYGVYVGITISFIITLWIGVGQQIYKPKLRKFPLSTSNCTTLFNSTGTSLLSSTGTSLLGSTGTSLLSSTGTALPAFFNASSIQTSTAVTAAATSSSDTLAIYNLSYLWFSALGCLTTVIIGLIVSFVAEKIRKSVGKKTDTELFSPVILAIYRRLPRKGKAIFYHSYVTVTTEEKAEADEKLAKKPVHDTNIVSKPSQVHLLSRIESTTNF